ncbi:hypothetical protein [Ammoniphilus sp. CFH 90114]|uniref:hypothetical protein n=1 Tax=Ammoniphilus sp. CFH 90114 TaxID=2493665 RepID=UPI00100FBC66|nr:hypothetical protein [Ammoniphilus sp. CFH 90114]RXT08147.1 hypothetical protein EIZ39_12155 [Ammoniphilus sp. CFH 90114]
MYTFNKPLHLSPYDHPDIYPGPTPKHSFIYMKGKAYPIMGSGDPSQLFIDFNGRTMTVAQFLKEQNVCPIEERYPILSYGSNICLAQLKYKYSLNPKLNDIVINLKGKLQDTDIIYAAYMTKYGALPAMLGPMEGAKCQVWLTLFDEQQFKHITHTEKIYSIASHREKKLKLSCGIKPVEFYAYYFNRALAYNGSFFRYPDIPATNSSAKEVWQAHMLQLLSKSFDLEREPFIDLVKTNVAFRRIVQRTLGLLSVPIKHADWTPVKKMKKWKDISQGL